MSDGELDAVIRDSLAAEAAGGVTTVRDLGDRHYRTPEARPARAAPRGPGGPPLTVVGGHCHYLGGR